MKIENILCGYLEENCYIVYNETDALIIDPGSDEDSINAFIKNNNLEVKAILITHYHFDHIGALEHLKEKYKPKIIDFNNIGEQKIGEYTFKVIETKGHTKDSVSFYFESEGILFSGDFLFKGSIGRYDFEDSSFTDMQKSIKWVKTLPKNTIILPGHGSETTLANELKKNDYLN